MPARPRIVVAGLSLSLSLTLLACSDSSGGDGGDGAATETDAETDTSDTESDTGETESDSTDTDAEIFLDRTVRVTLDGEPVEGATVIQGGTGKPFLTDADGLVEVTIDDTIDGDLVLIASHPEARSIGASVFLTGDSEMLFELLRFQVGDNIEYTFNPAGVPDNGGTTAECGHCHRRMKDDWHASPHRASVSNVVVQDVYAGAATAHASQAACEAAGGQWWEGLVPGTEDTAPRCYVGAGALPDLNADCGDVSACDQVATEFGQCADCHAPAIDGVAGGRDLLEATGTAYEAGVHCDLCHKVESVEVGGEPGVAGWLRLNRPFERSTKVGLGPWEVLAFGPYVDVPNPRMGASARDHFLSADFCGGCHQHDQPALVPGTVLDPARWPGGELPVHSTFAEWDAGPFSGNAPCSSCHMPADSTIANGADLSFEQLGDQGVAWGWVRPPGAVRRHSWVGPRNPDSNMLQLAAAVFVDSTVEGGLLTADVTVRNAGAGHAIPTGEPLRSLIALVRARCDADELVAVGGDAVPSFGGWLDRKDAPEDFSVWPGAEVGDVVRVVVDEGWHDYAGHGPFGDGSFDLAAKGLPALRVVGEATIVAVDGDSVTFDVPLPAGDVAYRGHGDPFADPTDPRAVAGAPGFAFARVLVDADGAEMVPHHRAVDVRSDNRILPQQEWTSSHVFATSCEQPTVDVTLVHRAYPIALASERGWDNPQQVMVEVSQ